MLLTLAAVLPAALLMWIYDGSARTPLPFVAAAIVTGILLWFGLLVFLKHPLLDEMRRLTGKLRPAPAA